MTMFTEFPNVSKSHKTGDPPEVPSAAAASSKASDPESSVHLESGGLTTTEGAGNQLTLGMLHCWLFRGMRSYPS